LRKRKVSRRKCGDSVFEGRPRQNKLGTRV
jgi:hypothetical protein